MKKVLVLGGTGAMGVYLLPELGNMGYDVYCTSRSLRKNCDHITYLLGNALDIEWITNVIQSTYYDAIIDFMIYKEDFRKYAQLFLSNTDHYIFLSSYRVYADSKVITEDSPRLLDVTTDAEYLKTDEYALLKARQENILFETSTKNWSIVRPTITFSKERFQLATYEAGTLLYRAKYQLPICLPQELLGKQTTLSWGGDVAKMMARLVLNEKAFGESFTLGASEHHSWQYIADIYQKSISLETKICTMKQYETIHQGHYAKLYYDRMYDRIIDNRKVLAATEMTADQLTPLSQSLVHELVNCKTFHCAVNINQCERIDAVLGTRTPHVDMSIKQKARHFLKKVPGILPLFQILKR
jgi:nucleoside-diphosphate-sugar epimerase